jgi:dephospho-CoA kinase
LADRIVVITGGIGCGKSLVADQLAGLGLPVVDADRISHELTGPEGSALPEIQAAFGRGVFLADGQLDRTALRKKIFSNPQEKMTLEAILHPLIQREAALQLAHAGGPVVVYVVPLWCEKYGKSTTESAHHRGLAQDPGFRPFAVVVVDCPEATQIKRVQARSGLSDKEVSAIIASQASRAVRLGMADFVIQNDGPLESLVEQVQTLHDKIIHS